MRDEYTLFPLPFFWTGKKKGGVGGDEEKRRMYRIVEYLPREHKGLGVRKKERSMENGNGNGKFWSYIYPSSRSRQMVVWEYSVHMR